MPLRMIPHAGRRLFGAGRPCIPSTSAALLPPSTFSPAATAQLLANPIGLRHCSKSLPRSYFKMAAPELGNPKEVRKYLQQSHDRIFENNKRWADEMKTKNPEFFTSLSAGQSPEYLWIGESTPALSAQRPRLHRPHQAAH